MLNEDDAKMYAQSVNNVARHYDVAVAQKTIDICNLVGMVAFIEGTRVLASRHAAQPPPRPSQVVPIMRFNQNYQAPPAQQPPVVTPTPADPPESPGEALH